MGYGGRGTEGGSSDERNVGRKRQVIHRAQAEGSAKKTEGGARVDVRWRWSVPRHHAALWSFRLIPAALREFPLAHAEKRLRFSRCALVGNILSPHAFVASKSKGLSLTILRLSVEQMWASRITWRSRSRTRCARGGNAGRGAVEAGSRISRGVGGDRAAGRIGAGEWRFHSMSYQDAYACYCCCTGL